MGVVFGALPGLTAPMAIAVMLPLTYSMEPSVGLALLLGAYCGVGYGGAIPAILLNIPGTPAAVMTAIDGNAMARRGQAGKALALSTIASFVAGVFSIFGLMFAAPWLARLSLKFGPHEYFAVGLLGLSITSCVVGKDWTKGFWSAALGVLIGTVGMDPLTNIPRFAFGNVHLLSGLPFIPIMIGLFGFSKVLERLDGKWAAPMARIQGVRSYIPSWNDMRRIAKSVMQGSITGTIIGALPGASGAIAAFLSYEIEKKTSPKCDPIDGRKFGEGRYAGVAAPEAANNSVTGGTLIPLLTLGIPGGAAVAIMLGALMMHNLTPGPVFFTKHLDVVYGIYISMFLANIFIVIACLLGIRFFVKLLTVPEKILMPAVMVLCIIGAYTLHNSIYDVQLMLIFGVVGFIFFRQGIPSLPLVLGMILGPIIETNLRQALIIEDGNFLNIFTRPISGTLTLLALLLFAFPLLSAMLKEFGSAIKGNEQ